MKGALLAIKSFFTGGAEIAGKVVVPATAVGAGAIALHTVNKYKLPLLIGAAALVAWKLGAFKRGK
jgi:hypothetical protein